MNKSVFTRVCCVFMALFIIFSSVAFAVPAETEENRNSVYASYASAAVTDIIGYLRNHNGSYTNGYIFNSNFQKTLSDDNSLRYITALSRLGFDENYSSCIAILTDIVKRQNQTTSKFNIEEASYWEGVCLALMACGYDPHSINLSDDNEAFDLVKNVIWKRLSSNSLDKDGLESLIYGLIVLDAYNTVIPYNEKATYTRESLIQQILSYQTEEGSFPASAGVTVPEMTALAAIALAPYKDLATVYSGTYFKTNTPFSYTIGYSIFKALDFLSASMDDNGEFSSFKRETISVLSKIIIALSSLQIDPTTDTRFIKNGRNPISVLLSKKDEAGKFELSEYQNDTYENTAYALEALAAYLRYSNGLTAYYNFSDTALKGAEQLFIAPDMKWASEYYTDKNSNVSTADYEDIIVIIYKAKNSVLADQNKHYIQKLETFADSLYDTKLKIARLNEQAEELLLPQTVMGTKTAHSVELITKEYNSLSIADQRQVTKYGPLMDKKNSSNVRTFFMRFFFVLLSIFIIAAILLGIFFLIRTTSLWNYLYYKYFLQKQLDDGYDEEGEEDAEEYDDFDEMPILDEEKSIPPEAALPFEDNDDFFNYDYPTGSELEDENFKIY